MREFLGVLIWVVLLLAAIAIAVVTIAVAVRGRGSVARWVSGLVAVLIIGCALWFSAAPVIVDGVTCSYGPAAKGLVYDGAIPLTDFTTTCLHQARRIEAWWLVLAAIAAVGWLVLIRGSKGSLIGRCSG
ncbi:hypothetical protein [Isoptericola luteus]|uniref:hypothetical protein n=1 Tax=Isoptericola luteus TaxID=2879484 RepID=UPI001CE035A2|nr:hypothetical protein [Isoptericola sp. NEAU-Y5]